MKIAGLDPGKQKSSFALVGVEVKDNKIFVKGAKSWLGKAYLKVENDIEKIQQKQKFSYLVVEQNNVGIHVVEVLRDQKHLPIKAVTTSIHVKEATTDKMDKNAMVQWLLLLQQEGRLIWPKKTTPEVDELKRQWSLFEEKKTETGKVSYSAPGEQHDDYVMALMLACHVAREYIDNDREMTVASKKFKYEDEDDEFGSGIPKHRQGWEAGERVVYWPGEGIR